jgi:hypothetical protein
MDQCRDRARPQAARREPSVLLIFGDDFGSACTVLGLPAGEARPAKDLKRAPKEA